MAGLLGTLMGRITLDVSKAVAGYAALRAQNARTVYALRGAGDSFVQAGQTMTLMGAAGVYGFARVVLAAAEFERKMDFAAAVTNTTGEAMQGLSKFALQLSKDTIYSAGEIADGFIELAKAGVTAEQIVGGIGEAMANLGAAGDIPLMESGQIITSTIQQFDKAAGDAIKVTDLLAGAANASIADITDIGVSLKYVGGVANAAGLELEDTVTAISLLAKAGIRGSTAGTSLRQMIVSLGGATKPARETLFDLGIMTEDGGNKFFTAEGKAKSLSKVFQILQKHTADLTQKERLMALRTIFNNRALSAASILTREGAKGFREMNAEMSKTTAADVARERLDNLSGDLEILKGNIETLMIEAGGPFQKTLRGWVQSLTKLVQAFGDLSPSTQEAIIQSIAIASAMLVAMGTISIVIGTILRFVASMLKMAAGMKFLWGLVRTVIFNLRFLAFVLAGPLMGAISAAAAALGVTVGVFLLIIAVIAALVAGVVILYKKWEPFRNVVNSVAKALWTGIKAIGAFFKALVTDPGRAWDMLKDGMAKLGGWVAQLGQWIWSGLKKGLSYIGQFATEAIEWFLSLPGKVLGALGAFVSKVVSYLTFRNVGYALGFLVGTILRLFITLQMRVISIVGTLASRVAGFFAALPAKIGYLIGFLIGRAIALFISLHTKVMNTVVSLVYGVVAWFRRLPGRVGAFILIMVARVVNAFHRLRERAPVIISGMVSDVRGFISELPGKVGTFVESMVTRAVKGFKDLKAKATDFASQAVNGFVEAFTGLPDLVWGTLNAAIGIFQELIQAAFNAAKDFAGGLWDGFKSGLGINSPSFIEEAAWQITGVLDEETKKLANQTMRIQSLGRKMIQTPISVGDPNAVRAAESYASLASMQVQNQKRARTLLASPGSASGTSRSSATSGGEPSEVPFRITNWRDGTGMMQDIAQDAVESDRNYEDTLGRMG